MSYWVCKKGVKQMKSEILKSYVPMILGIVIVLCLSGCKGFGVPDYELKIEVRSGVEGTPASGTYTYKELTSIDYSYFPQNDEHQVEVLVNGSRWLAAGTFIMYTNLEVVVQIVDIRGTWDFLLTSTDSDVEDIQFEITFSGDNLIAGSFTDDRGYSGTWNANGANLTITYSNWENYSLTGSIITMRGDIYNGDEKTGTWSASRN
jgi:hypothetical protein